MTRPSPLPWPARFSPTDNLLRSLWEALWDRLQGCLRHFYEGDGASARALLVQACRLLEELTHQIVQELGTAAERLLPLCQQLAKHLSSGNAEQILSGLSMLYYLGGVLILVSHGELAHAAASHPIPALMPVASA